MPTRRLVLLGAAVWLATPARAASEGPDALLTRIYRSVTGGDGTAGGAEFTDKTARRRYFVRAICDAWDKAEADAERDGEIGPIDFDPLTDSQDPSVGRFELRPLTTGEDTAKLRVTLFARRRPAPNERPRTTLDVTLKREADGWRIDDIARTAGDTPWRLREILSLP